MLFKNIFCSKYHCLILYSAKWQLKQHFTNIVDYITIDMALKPSRRILFFLQVQHLSHIFSKTVFQGRLISAARKMYALSIIESLRLEKASKIIKVNREPIALPSQSCTVYCQNVQYLPLFKTLWHFTALDLLKNIWKLRKPLKSPS